MDVSASLPVTGQVALVSAAWTLVTTIRASEQSAYFNMLRSSGERSNTNTNECATLRISVFEDGDWRLSEAGARHHSSRLRDGAGAGSRGGTGMAGDSAVERAAASWAAG